MIKTIVYIITLLCLVGELVAQVNSMSLEEAIQLTNQYSIENTEARYNVNRAQKNLDIIESLTKPQLRLNASIPQYFKTSQSVTQPDGSISFQSISQNDSRIGATLSKTLMGSNTSVYLQSNLNQFDNFINDETSYNSVPLRIGISQPINGFNDLKWRKKIAEKTIRTEDKAAIQKSLLSQVNTTRAFFDLLAGQTEVRISRSNLDNNTEIYRIAQERFRLGKISEDDLLQIELNLNNSKKDLAAAKRNSLQFRYLLLQAMNQFEITDSLDLAIPDELPNTVIDPSKAAELAWINNPLQTQTDLALLQNEQELDYVKKTSGFQATLEASLGLVRSANDFDDVYRDLQNETLVSLRLAVPILDGKYRKNLIRRTGLDREFYLQNADFSEKGLKQNVAQLAQQVNLLGQEASLAYENYTIAQKRYDIANQRYALGNINNTDLSIAFSERDYALRSYILTLRDYWVSYYTIQQLTQYDFASNETIQLQ